MTLHLNDYLLPIRIRSSLPLTDDELMTLSRENEAVRIERTADGE